MNPEENRKFEALLKEARPARVNTDLAIRIARQLEKEERGQRLARLRCWAGWAGLTLAACAVLSFGILLFNGRLTLTPDNSMEEPVPGEQPAEAAVTGAQPDPDAFKPVFAENNLKNRIDEGIVFLRSGLAARRYRYEFVDRVVWENPSNGAVVEMEIPRDEVVLVPVQTF